MFRTIFTAWGLFTVFAGLLMLYQNINSIFGDNLWLGLKKSYFLDWKVNCRLTQCATFSTFDCPIWCVKMAIKTVLSKKNIYNTILKACGYLDKQKTL